MTSGRQGKHESFPTATRVLLVVAMLGFVARLVLWQLSFGTNDVFLWGRIGKAINTEGIRWAYVNDPDCNQPPGQPIIAAGAYLLGKWTDTKFPTWFKLPLLAADLLVMWLIWKILRPRRGPTFAAAIMALFAWNPVSILVSGHHGNLDPLYVGLALLAVWLMEDRRRMFAGGLVLGAAINVKLVPALLIPPMLASCRRWGDAGRLIGGLAIMAVPSLIILALEPAAFRSKVLSYAPAPEHWGIGHFLLEAMQIPRVAATAEQWLLWFNTYGKRILAGLIVAMSIFQAVTHRWDRYVLTAATFTLFLVLASGFGLQYTVAAAAILLIVWPAGGVAYALVGGAYVLIGYLLRWDGKLPLVTWFHMEFEYRPGRIFGQLAWGVLVLCLVRLLSRRRAADAFGNETLTSANTCPPPAD